MINKSYQIDGGDNENKKMSRPALFRPFESPFNLFSTHRKRKRKLMNNRKNKFSVLIDGDEHGDVDVMKIDDDISGTDADSESRNSNHVIQESESNNEIKDDDCSDNHEDNDGTDHNNHRDDDIIIEDDSVTKADHSQEEEDQIDEDKSVQSDEVIEEVEEKEDDNDDNCDDDIKNFILEKEICDKRNQINKNICNTIKNDALNDVRKIENLVTNLKKKEFELEDIIQKQNLEMINLSEIIISQPGDVKKMQKLLDETIEEMNSKKMENHLIITNLENNLRDLIESESHKTVLLNDINTEMVELRFNFDIVEKENISSIMVNDQLKDENKFLLQKSIELNSLVIKHSLLEEEQNSLNIQMSNMIIENDNLIKNLDEIKKEKNEIRNYNSKIQNEIDRLSYQNDILKQAIIDNYRLHEKECSRLLESQYSEIMKIKKTKKKLRKSGTENNLRREYW